MSDTKKLLDMVDNIIKDNPSQPQVDFHEYLSVKMPEIIQKVREVTKQSKD